MEKVIADFESISVYPCNWTRLRIMSSVQDFRFFKLILRPTFDAFISSRRKTFSAWSIVSQLIVMSSAYTRAPIRTAG